MKILVTGAAGFIASNFVRRLVEVRPNWEIVALDLLTYAGNLENIKDLIEENKLTFVKADIADSLVISELFHNENFEMVFNFAAESHVDRSIISAASFVRTNVMGTQVLVDAARVTGVKRFIQISTDEVYGSLGETGVFYENTPLDPTSPYSASKAGGDLVALAAQKTHGMDLIVTRCTNNYGRYQFPEKFIPLFITNALEDRRLPLYGDGMNVRSWIHVHDHNDGVLLIAEKGRSGEVYNLGSTEEGELPNITVAKVILEKLGKSEDLIQYVGDRAAHDRRYAVSIEKMNKELGWEPKISFAQGMDDTINWYVNNQDWWKNIKSGAYLEYYNKQYSSRLSV